MPAIIFHYDRSSKVYIVAPVTGAIRFFGATLNRFFTSWCPFDRNYISMDHRNAPIRYCADPVSREIHAQSWGQRVWLKETHLVLQTDWKSTKSPKTFTFIRLAPFQKPIKIEPSVRNFTPTKYRVEYKTKIPTNKSNRHSISVNISPPSWKAVHVCVCTV